MVNNAVRAIVDFDRLLWYNVNQTRYCKPNRQTRIFYSTSMSHPYRGRSGRGSYSRSNTQDQGDGSHPGSSQCTEDGQQPKKGKHPPWLKGKEIGLFYKNRMMKDIWAREKEKNFVASLVPEVQERILSALQYPKSYYEGFHEFSNSANKTGSTSNLEDKYMHINDSHFKRKFLEIISGNIQENLNKAVLNSALQKNELLDNVLLDEYLERTKSEEYINMLRCRLKLPAFQKRQEIIELVQKNQVVVISGETGCGKTTQVAQFLLDNLIETKNGSITRIACTQPRRISAISVAERVAAERAERLGISVGFQIRLEKVPPRDRGSILFCTTGMLLQFMKSDAALTEFSHIILDEIHERSTESDFIITLLKQVIPQRPDLKVILMSATLNSESFSKYYDNCPMIHIPGFTFPVEEFYLEDVLHFTQFKFPELSMPHKHKKNSRKYKQLQQMVEEFHTVIDPYVRQLIAEKKYPKEVIDQVRNPNSENLSLELIERLIRYICTSHGPGAILVFLPGMMDITKLSKLLTESGRYPQSAYVIYPLHSRMPTIDQKLIFKEPPEGVRKIIIATSIAETSITIEDVVYVINCGKTKLNRLDIDKNLQTLQAEWVALANAKQRRGRAGRVKSGYCYHLYSRGREMTFEQYPLPEILRTRLEEVILQIKLLQLGKAREFLSKVMDPPDPKSIDLSIDLLRTLNALDSDETLTPLGYHLAQLPLDPRTGKMIIWAALFSCVEPVFAIAASLTFKDAFYCPWEKEEEARKKKLELSLNEYSDHIALAEALRRFEQAYKRGDAGYFCREYFLSMNTLKLLSEMKTQFGQHLYEMKFLDSENPSDRNANRNSHNLALIKAIVCAGLYPNIAEARRPTRFGILAWTPEDGRVKTHPSSVNYSVQRFPCYYLTYFTKQRSTEIYLHDTTFVSTTIILFASLSTSIKREKGKCIITLSTSQSITCEPRTAEIIQKLRQELNDLLEFKISHPGTIQWSTREGVILNAIIELVSQRDDDIRCQPLNNIQRST